MGQSLGCLCFLNCISLFSSLSLGLLSHWIHIHEIGHLERARVWIIGVGKGALKPYFPGPCLTQIWCCVCFINCMFCTASHMYQRGTQNSIMDPHHLASAIITSQPISSHPITLSTYPSCITNTCFHYYPIPSGCLLSSNPSLSFNSW